MCLLGGGTGSGEAHNCEFSQEKQAVGSQQATDKFELKVKSTCFSFCFWGGAATCFRLSPTAVCAVRNCNPKAFNT